MVLIWEWYNETFRVVENALNADHTNLEFKDFELNISYTVYYILSDMFGR